MGKAWYHLHCFNLKSIFAGLKPEENVFGLDKLHKEDHDDIIDYLHERLKEMKKSKGDKSKGKAKGNKS